MDWRQVAWFILGGLSLLGTEVGGAQPAAPSGKTPSAPLSSLGETVEGIDKKLAELDASSVDEAIKVKAREYYQQARAELEQGAAVAAQLADFRDRIATAADRLIQQQILESRGESGPPLLSPPENAELGELDRVLAERQSEWKRLDELAQQLDAEPMRRGNRRLEIPKQVAALKEQIAEAEGQIAAPPDPGEVAVVAQARRTLLSARWQVRKSQAEGLLAELATYDAEKDLPNRERTRLRSRLSQVAQSAEDLTTLINNRRNSEAELRHQRVKEQSDFALPANRDRATVNLALSEEIRQLARDVMSAASSQTVLEKELADWKARIEKSRRRVEKGPSSSTVAALRQDRINAADRASRLQKEMASRDAMIRDLQDRLLEMQDLGDEYADVDAMVETIARNRGFSLSPEEETSLKDDLRGLLLMYKELIDDHGARTNQYFEKLIEMNDTSEDLRRELASYLAFINERILWMRSSDAISFRTFRTAASQLVTMLTHMDGWFSFVARAGKAIWLEVTRQKVLTVTFVLVFLAIQRYQRQLRLILAGLGDMSAKGSCVRFLPTLEALAVTALVGLPWALAMLFVGWRLYEVGHAAGQGLLLTATIYLPLELFRQTCRRKGLCEAHFGWSDRVVGPLRTSLRWYVLFATPLILLAASLHASGDSQYGDSIGRLAFLVLMALTAWMAHRVARPKGGVFQEHLTYHAGGWADRLTMVWYPFLCLTPLALALLAGIGFYYSAWDLAMRFFRTIVIALLVVMVGALLHRLLLVSRRRLAMRQAREWRQRIQSDADGEDASKATQDAPIDLAAINQQSRRLIRSLLWLIGLTMVWVIWSDVLPALAVFTEIELYKTEGVEPGVMQRVTLKHVGLAGIVLIMMSVGARNIPGLIEIVLLQNLPLDSSVRYAITTVSRYLILLAGLIIMSSTLGISWRRAQWLVAALGVGLGFGLQEIFANLVSGIILLFERPIRVGDVITLGDVSGAVTRIRIRATTVRDWDGKELIVPNKELITGRLLNWTLSDTTTRIVVRVGVAYGSDVTQACQLIMEAVAGIPAILADPPPTVTFEAFGDSSLSLAVRAFIPRLDQRLPCTHLLHMAIDERFRAHKIEIAFPQMDIHIRDIAKTSG